MTKLTTIGIDLAKNVFALVALSSNGRELWRKTVRRQRLMAFLAKQEKAVTAMEACASSHYWAREFQALGFEVKLLPAQHVKGYQRGQKNDYNDARAIAEASLHGSIRPVPIKSLEQQDEQVFLGVRRSLEKERTRLSNQMRGLLAEYGQIVSPGISALRKAVPEILEDAENGLTVRFRALLNRQYRRFVELSEELAWYDQELKRQAKEDDVCRRLDELPGVGEVVAAALKGWLGNGQQFQRGRDASAALGLVPRQHSSGGKEVLYGITKRGDRYLRSLVVHGARSVVARADGKSDRLSRWIQRLKAQKGFNKAAVALANKLVRIAWVIVARGERYRPTGQALATNS